MTNYFKVWSWSKNQLNNCLSLGEHVLSILDHAWKHLLHEKSRVIPGKARLYTALVISKKLSKNTSFGQLDWSNLKLTSEEFEPYDCERLHIDQVIGPEQILLDIDFNDKAVVEDLLRNGKTIKQSFKIEEKEEIFHQGKIFGNYLPN